MNATYLVAKCVPDLTRREPFNIGIMLYDEGRWFGRFVGEDPATGTIDRRRLRSRFSSQEAYIEWLHFWRKATERGLEDTTGEIVRPDDDTFTGVLCGANSAQFLVEMGEPMLLPAAAGGGDSLLSYLFAMLVGEGAQSGQQDHGERTLRQKMQDVIFRYGLDRNPCFHQPYEVDVPVRGMTQKLVFPYAYVNGSRRVYRRMAIDASTWEADPLQMAVNNVLWSFEKIRESGKDCTRVVLVEMGGERGTSGIAREAHDLVSTEAERVVDVDAPDEVEAEFSPLVAA